MSEWSESEVQKVLPGVDDNRLVQFSSVVDETRYCIPRWLTLKDDKTVETELYKSCTETTKGALVGFLRTNRKNFVSESDMPYCLCKIEYIPKIGWTAADFISVHVASCEIRVSVGPSIF